MTALIIIDLQHDFCDGGPMANCDSIDIITKINSIRDDYDFVIFVKKSYPVNHLSFKNNGGNIVKHCVSGTNGCELQNGLIVKKTDMIINRCTKENYNSNSGFYDDESREIGTKLKYFLQVNNIRDLYFCGNNMETCIFSTILDALNYKFNCFVIEDAIGCINKEKSQEKIKFLITMDVQIIGLNSNSNNDNNNMTFAYQ